MKKLSLLLIIALGFSLVSIEGMAARPSSSPCPKVFKIDHTRYTRAGQYFFACEPNITVCAMQKGKYPNTQYICIANSVENPSVFTLRSLTDCVNPC